MSARFLPLFLALALPSAAQAFCGTYVGEAGAELTSGASKVVLVRQGNRTVLTLANDVEGSVKDFAVVIPVPEVLTEEDVAVLDPAIMDTVAEYSGPRLVEYACEDFAWTWERHRNSCDGIGCNEQGLSIRPLSADTEAGSLDVTVEAEFAAGEYDIVVLSSEDSADLLTWLQLEGYGVTEEAAEVLGDYVDSGSKFLAAKVRLDDVPTGDGFEGRPYLSPLQLTYQSDVFSLPIRLGTVNSPGSQDLVVYAVNETSEGPVAIANYSEFYLDADAFENECIYDEDVLGPIDEYLDAKMETAVDAHGGAAWTRTYSWSPVKCDPCPPGGPLGNDVMGQLGFEGDGSNSQFTRLWVRFTPEAATEDLVFYSTGRSTMPQMQLRYILPNEGLEEFFPVCEAGMADPKSYQTCESQVKGRDGGSQASAAPWWLGLSALGLLTGLGVALRRRR